ncbi:MAG: hypothetical protein BGP09_03865 [Rhizobium sp. 60-20]|nr:MAG: hypothetical protein BGP09_03865 [Rhizobium sp. 60-20]
MFWRIFALFPKFFLSPAKKAVSRLFEWRMGQPAHRIVAQMPYAHRKAWQRSCRQAANFSS